MTEQNKEFLCTFRLSVCLLKKILFLFEHLKSIECRTKTIAPMFDWIVQLVLWKCFLSPLSSTISPVSNATAVLHGRVVQHLDYPAFYASVQIYFRLCHFPERLIQLNY